MHLLPSFLVKALNLLKIVDSHISLFGKMHIPLVNAANLVSLRSENGISFFRQDLQYQGAGSSFGFLCVCLPILLQYLCTQHSHICHIKLHCDWKQKASHVLGIET